MGTDRSAHYNVREIIVLLQRQIQQNELLIDLSRV